MIFESAKQLQIVQKRAEMFANLYNKIKLYKNN